MECTSLPTVIEISLKIVLLCDYFEWNAIIITGKIDSPWVGTPS
jgi:hypothetical protein